MSAAAVPYQKAVRAWQTTRTGSGLGGNAFLWLALLTAGSTFFLSREAPFKDSRPPPAVAVADQQADRPQHIDARLWQDPFSAVEKSRQDRKIVVELTPSLGSGSSEGNVLVEAHQRAASCDQSDGSGCSRFSKHGSVDANSQLLVLGVMVSRASYAEDAEFRRRIRYAVLAALDVEGYKPDDPAHIGALSLPRDLLSSSLIPFEWLSIAESQSEKKTVAKPPPKKILVLWLDEDAFFDNYPLERFGHIADAVAREFSRAKFKILGPEYSDTLKSIVDEQAGRCKPKGDGCELDFYLYSSTIEVEKDRGLPTVHRVIATDKVLAEHLVEELKRRGLDPSITTVDARGRLHHKHHVAIVSEWDIGYGEAQPELFAEAVGGGDRTWLHPFSYLRGLDGEQAVSAADKSPSSDGSDGAKTPNVRPGPAQLERAEGEGQFDYLRRLSDRIKRTDAQLRERGDQIDAIGVLGTDLYDKLLILQALRPRFPDALFFTTDYDERLLHPSEVGWTRNLIVASSYGTQLREEVQRDIPPFRSNYQTAAFLAARYAVHSSTTDEMAAFDHLLHEELGTARLAEIGLTGAQWLPTRLENHIASDDVEAERVACGEELFQCKHFQPAADRLYPELSSLGAFAAALVSGTSLMLAVPFLSGRVRRRVRRRLHHIRTVSGLRRYDVAWCARYFLFAAIPVLLVCLFWSDLANLLTGFGEGEPLKLQGTSLWPTTIIRLISVLLCTWLVMNAAKRSSKNTNEITHDFGFRKSKAQLLRDQSLINAHRSFSARLFTMFSRNFGDSGGSREDPELRFWRNYLAQGQLGPRLARACVGVALMMILFGILSAIFGGPVTPAHRGVMIGALYPIVTFANVVAMLLLLFLAADGALYLLWFIRALRNKETHWPDEVTTRWQKRIGAPSQFLDDWIDLTFVASRTKATSTIIYYPFIAIAVLILSRSRLLDNFSENVPILATSGISIAIVIGCSVALCRSAEHSRQVAIDRLDKEIILTSGTNDSVRAAQLTALRSHIQQLSEGAFTPWSQQPLVKALLLPVGSFGGTALLEYLSLPMP